MSRVPEPAPPLSAPAQAQARPWRDLARDFALAGFLGLFTLAFLFQPFRVEGVSMMPRLAHHDRIIVNKLSYRVGAIARGDVVVFWYPEEPGSSFVKRVIGLPGDMVELRGGTVLVNGQALSESYVATEFRRFEDRPAVVVGKGYYYVLGDHRDQSFDSRDWGLVPQRYIYGRVVMSYWPPAHLGLIEHAEAAQP